MSETTAGTLLAQAEQNEGMLHTVGGNRSDERATKRRKERAVEIAQALKDLATAHGGPVRSFNGNAASRLLFPAGSET